MTVATIPTQSPADLLASEALNPALPPARALTLALLAIDARLAGLLIALRPPSPPEPPVSPALPGDGEPDAVIRIVAKWLEAVVWHRPGRVFTIAEIRRIVLDSTGVDFIQLDRRIRDLRDYAWVLDTYREDPSLKPAQRRLVKIGWDVTDPACRRQEKCSAPVKREVYERDGKACQICGVQNGEAYPDQPDRIARMTVGRILPGAKGGRYTIENCQVQCARCNEDVRDRYDRHRGQGKAA
jgi:5-methylcytosine-specific restriction endonuclease McrA